MLNKLNQYPIYIFVSIMIIACSDKKEEVKPIEPAKIDSVFVSEKYTLTETDQGFFYYPRFSPDGSKVFFTSSNYRGISYYDLNSNKVVLLNNMPGSGFDICFSSDHSAIFFKSDTMQNRRRYYNLYQQDLRTHELFKLNEQAIQRVTGLAISAEDQLSCWVDKQLMSVDLNSRELKSATSSRPLFNLQGGKLIIARNDSSISYTPFPNQNLIWIEPIAFSSDILIYVVGQGLYKFNPADNSSNLVGDFRAARCSPDGRLLAYMYDLDDGHQIINSDIFVATTDDYRSFPITNTRNEIEMYPEWAPDGQRLVYHTESGVIELIHIEYN